MAWTIVEQTEKVGKNEITVLCKHVKFFPKVGAGGQVEGFGLLKNLCLRIIIRSSAGWELKLNMSITKGLHDHPIYSVVHPDSKGKPMIWVGAGKNRRQIKDELSPDVVIPGERESYPYEMDFEKRVKPLVGAEMYAEIMDLFRMKHKFLRRAA